MTRTVSRLASPRRRPGGDDRRRRGVHRLRLATRVARRLHVHTRILWSVLREALGTWDDDEIPSSRVSPTRAAGNASS